MQVEWSMEARASLIMALEYGVQAFNNKAVDKFYRQILSAERMLATMPQSGKREPALADMVKEYRSLVIHSHYKLIYTIDYTAQILFIVALWDTRANPQSLTTHLKCK